MGFDSRGFLGAALSARTEDVRVPDLAPWFGESEPVWTVRGLDANEIVRSDAAKTRLTRESALAEALRSGGRLEIVREVQEALGRTPADVEPDTARRIEILCAGSVDPACDMETAVKLAATFPVVFFQLTNAILTLTGRGSDAEKKPRSSGATPQ